MDKDDFGELLGYHPQEAEELLKIGNDRHKSIIRKNNESNTSMGSSQNDNVINE